MTDSAETIRNRTFAFACAVAKLALQLQPRPGIRCLIDQLLKSATSVGANLEEAKAASSKREFVRYVEIALREAREASYWLRIARSFNCSPLSTSRISAAVFAFCILNFALVS
jgi:four helix bundle protein